MPTQQFFSYNMTRTS